MFEKDMLSEEKEKIIEIINRYYSKGKMNIQEKIRQVCRNEQLESEVTKINQEIRNLFSEYAIIDWTDEDSCCYEQHILLHERQEILDDGIELIMSLGGKREVARTKVPNIETELKYAGQATIFACLFSDKVDIEK